MTPPHTTTEWEHYGHPEILQIYVLEQRIDDSEARNEFGRRRLYGCDGLYIDTVPR